MADFQVGEIVDITIKGARFVSTYEHFTRWQDGDGVVFSVTGQALITRVAPADWPPQLGDLWRDREGDLWFGFPGFERDGGPYVNLRSSRDKSLDGWGAEVAHYVIAKFGPLTLVHREKQDGGEGQ